MQRHIIDHPKDRNSTRRLAEFCRQDRVPRRIIHRTERHRGTARVAQYLRIAQGRPA